jgi:hypothetical protein
VKDAGDDRRHVRGLEELEAVRFENRGCWDGKVRIERIEGVVAVREGRGR